MKKTKPEWAQFDFDELERPSHQLAEVTHIAHWSHAMGIFDSGNIKRGPIRENGKLNNLSSKVCWVSCNNYARSVYGTISFTFPWAKLVKGKDIYWIEAVQGEQITLRFLLRDKNMSEPRGLQRYDPKEKHGPLKRRGSKWYFSTENRLVGHFLVEQNLPLEWCTWIKAVDHHATSCHLDKKPCPEALIEKAQTCAKIISYLIGTSNTKLNHLVFPVVSGQQIVETLDWAETELSKFFEKELSAFEGLISRRSEDALFRKICLHFSKGDLKKVRERAAQFRNIEVLEKAMHRLMAEDSGIDTKKFTPSIED